MRTASLGLALLCIVGVVHAERIYRWTGADGKTHYGDMPPGNARDVRGLEPRIGATRPPPAAATQTEQEVAAREAACATKRAQLGTYRNAVQLVERDSLGRQREFTAEERQQLVAKVEAEIQASCEQSTAE